MAKITAIESVENRIEEITSTIKEKLAKLDSERAEAADKIRAAEAAAETAIREEDEAAYLVARREIAEEQHRIEYLDRQTKRISEGALITLEEYDDGILGILQEMHAHQADAEQELDKIADIADKAYQEFNALFVRANEALQAWQREAYRYEDLPKDKNGRHVPTRPKSYRDQSMLVALRRIREAIDGYKQATR